MSLRRRIKDTLFPGGCHLCGTALMHGEQFVCTACLSEIPRSRFYAEPDNLMVRRFLPEIRLRRCASLFLYSHGSPLSELVQDFKYRDFPSLARWLGMVMGRELLPTGYLSDVDAIVPVPMFWLKRLMRGYNQVERIADGLGKECGIPVSKCMVSPRPHATQTRKDSEQRRRNVSGVFSISGRVAVPKGHLLLVDDICTTGATLSEAALTLQAAGAESLSILTLAFAHR